MGWKMFKAEGKFGSAKKRVFKIVRLVGGLGQEDCDVSPCTPTSTVVPYVRVDPLADYSLEAELKKAQALMYWHMLNQPK